MLQCTRFGQFGINACTSVMAVNSNILSGVLYKPRKECVVWRMLTVFVYCASDYTTCFVHCTCRTILGAGCCTFCKCVASVLVVYGPVIAVIMPRSLSDCLDSTGW
jgi:hypothetical protein